MFFKILIINNNKNKIKIQHCNNNKIISIIYYKKTLNWNQSFRNLNKDLKMKVKNSKISKRIK